MRITAIVVLAISTVMLGGCQSNPKSDTELVSAQSETRAMAAETLAKLDQLQPGARKAVESAYGHAVFSNFGMKILVAGGGSGRGIAVGPGGAETFMRMAEVQAGLGMGVKKFRLVWAFATEQAYRDFLEKGWTFGAQATAAAQAADRGTAMAGALSVAPGVYLYQITDNGLALELTVKGTKYYKDDALNQQ